MRIFDLKKILDENNKIKRWPKKPIEKEVVIGYLAHKFNFDSDYSESNINDIIKENHLFDDIALLRRELIGRKYLSRLDDGSKYWRIK